MMIELTVADHEANGFIGLARWNVESEDDARNAISAIDALVDDDMEPDHATADFAFILDLHDDSDGLPNCIDNGKRALPLQIAMRLAPEQTEHWLKTRPNPNTCHHYGTLLDGLPQ